MMMRQSKLVRRWGVAASALWAAACGLLGCGRLGRSAAAGVDPLPIQQRQAYPETVTGRFVSLADFEDSALTGEAGYRQVGQFILSPAGSGGELKYVVNITRTGVGALEAALPGGSALVWALPELHDFSPYTLLMLAIYSREIRDDLKIVLQTDRAGWQSPPVLLKPGWNDICVDIQRLMRFGDFRGKGVRLVRFEFTASSAGPSARPVRINLDDVMLIDNRRRITPAPPGVEIRKSGLDYELRLQHRSEPIRLAQGPDGLWRLGADQALVELIATEGVRRAGSEVKEDLAAFGRRRVGQVRVLECNPVRLRLGNTWYFPTSAGQWESLAIRRIDWEYTFYGDGRWVTDLVINNAGGKGIEAVRIRAPHEATWSDGTVARTVDVRTFAGSVGRWSYLTATDLRGKALHEANFAKPGAIDVRIGMQDASDGDVAGDGFDESQGCYHLSGKEGHCRFLFRPPAEGLSDAVVRVGGPWRGRVSASSEGLPLRPLAMTPDGSAVFVVPGRVSRPVWVEVTADAPGDAE
ncbi:MAG: hypothetical protein ACYS5V_02120 [Planctomycetota bacterium]